MRSPRPTRGGTLFVFLAIAAAFSLAAKQAHAAGAANTHTVLILDPTVTGGAASLEAVQAVSLGFTVEVATAAQWAAKSQADFATYRALVLGDPTCGSGTTPIAAAVANRTTWSPAITGNVIVIGTDEVYHHISHPGGTVLTTNGIGFAANIPGQTGLFASLSCYYDSVSPQNVPLLDQFGTFTTSGTSSACFNDAHIVAIHPALAGLVDADLQNWGCSVHEIFTAFPASFLPLAIARGITGSGSLTFADGSFGVPYILAKGSGLQAVGLNILKSGPATANVGDNITYTITYGNTGSSDALSTVITDPVPAGTTFVSATGGGTYLAGVVTWNIGTVTHGVTGLTVQFTVHINSGPSVTNTNYQIHATGVTPVVGPDVVTTVPGPSPTATPTPTPTIAPAPTQIPTLSFPMLGLLALALVAAAFVLMRR
jgi:uncharacterized repeat protein (TIGR01451 family)